MEDVLQHPSLVRLLGLTDDIKWVYHVAEQLLIAESNALDKGANDNFYFEWDHDYIDMLFQWDQSPQGFKFWSSVSNFEIGNNNGEAKPYFIDGEMVMK